MRLKNYERCRREFRELIAMLDPQTIPPGHKALFEKWVAL
jgi:hypothetical protein